MEETLQGAGGKAHLGGRFAAVNSKKRNFTQEKLDKRIKEIGEQIDQGADLIYPIRRERVRA